MVVVGFSLQKYVFVPYWPRFCRINVYLRAEKPKCRHFGGLPDCRINPNAMTVFMKTALLYGLCVWCSLSAVAQHARRDSHAVRRKSPTSLAVDEAARRYQTKFDSLVATFSHWRYEEADTLNNPYYASLMGSPTL